MAVSCEDIKSTITEDKVDVKIDLSSELKGLPSYHKTKITSEIVKYLDKQIREDANKNALSSVSGKRFTPLEKKYKAKKEKAGKGGRANLKLTGAMFEMLKEQGAVQSIRIKVEDETQIKKFYNHNAGDTLPQRQVLPNTGEAFRSGIMKSINKLIRDGKKEAIEELKKDL